MSLYFLSVLASLQISLSCLVLPCVNVKRIGAEAFFKYDQISTFRVINYYRPYRARSSEAVRYRRVAERQADTSPLEVILLSHSFLALESAGDGIGMMEEPLDDVAPQTIDLLDMAPLLWIVMHNLSGTQPTVVEQGGQSLLTGAGQQSLEDLPNLGAVHLVFPAWLTCLVEHRPQGFSWQRKGPQCVQDGPIQTRSQVRLHPGWRLACHLRLDSGLPESLKGLSHQVLFARPSTRSLSTWMLMQPGQDGLLQALLEPCPGLLIAVCNRTAQELQARHLDRLVSITSHVDAPCVPTGATPFLQGDQGLFLLTIIPLRPAEPLVWPLHSLAHAADRRCTRRRRCARCDQVQRRPTAANATP